MGMVPTSVVDKVGKEWRGEGEELPSSAVREHLALQTYLTAVEAFNDWFDHYHRGAPVKPVLGQNPSFTERVAHEQGEEDRWSNQGRRRRRSEPCSPFLVGGLLRRRKERIPWTPGKVVKNTSPEWSRCLS